MPEPAQLPLPLPASDLPTLALPADWKDRPRSFGHAFHPLCTYLGGLPPAMAHALVERLSRPGDVVLDPFCGRGTVPLQAAIRRRVGVGVDRNPLAHLLAGAVLDPPTHREAQDRLAHLRIDWTRVASDWRADAARLLEGSEVAPALFHGETLAELLFLRASLRREERVDRFLLATLAGILHGSRRSYLTDAMPNAFSLAPRYAQAWLATHAPDRPRREAFALTSARLRRLFRDGPPVSRGIAIAGDARESAADVASALRSRGLPERVRLVVTSPPYLRVVRYGMANWLRLWLLGEDPVHVDAALSAPATPDASAALLSEVLADLRPLLAPDAVVVLVLGDVERDRGRRLTTSADLAEGAWLGAARPAGYLLAGFADDRVADERKLTRLWGAGAGRATRTDRLLVIAPTEAGRRRALSAGAGVVDWSPSVAVAPRLDLSRRPTPMARRAPPEVPTPSRGRSGIGTR